MSGYLGNFLGRIPGAPARLEPTTPAIRARSRLPVPPGHPAPGTEPAGPRMDMNMQTPASAPAPMMQPQAPQPGPAGPDALTRFLLARVGNAV